MKLPEDVKADLSNLYNSMRDAQEVYREATKFAAAKHGKKAKHVRQHIKLLSIGKLAEFENDAQLVLEL